MHAGCSGKNGICLIPGLGQISEQHQKTPRIYGHKYFGISLLQFLHGNCNLAWKLQQIIEVLQALFFLSVKILLTARITFPKKKKKKKPRFDAGSSLPFLLTLNDKEAVLR